MEFSRQEYWSGFPFPAPGDLPDPGIKPTFLALARGLFTTEPPVVKNLPAMQKTWVQFLGQEDPLEKGMASPSSILAWRIPCTEEPGGL